MRCVSLSTVAVRELLKNDFTQSDVSFYTNNKHEYKTMWSQQGNEFWIKFVIVVKEILGESYDYECGTNDLDQPFIEFLDALLCVDYNSVSSYITQVGKSIAEFEVLGAEKESRKQQYLQVRNKFQVVAAFVRLLPVWQNSSSGSDFQWKIPEYWLSSEAGKHKLELFIKFKWSVVDIEEMFECDRNQVGWLSGGTFESRKNENVSSKESEFQKRENREVATTNMKQNILKGGNPPQGPKASLKWLQVERSVTHIPRHSGEAGNLQLLRQSNSNNLRIWELVDVALPEILDRKYYTNDVKELLKNQVGYEFMGVAAVYTVWDNSFGLKYLHDIQEKCYKLETHNIKMTSNNSNKSINTNIDEWKKRVDEVLTTVKCAKNNLHIMKESDIASRASEFLLEPCIAIQLPWNCVLLHQWLAASLVEVLIIEHKSTELRHWPLPDKVVLQATELMTLVKQAKERIILGFAIMSKQVEMHPKVDRKHPAMIMDQVVLPSLATLQFLISGNATKILKSVKKIAWSFSYSPDKLSYVPVSAYTMDDFLENVYSNLCYNFMIWEYVNVPAPFPGALFEQVDIDEVITRMNTKQTITPESNASMKPLSREEKFLCRIVDKNREAMTNSERVSIALKIIQECVIEPGRLPGLKLDQVRAYLDTEEIRSHAGFITREYDESSISDMILISSLLFYEVYGMLIGSEKETSILAYTVCQGLVVLEREQVIRLTKLLGEKFGIIPVAVNTNKDNLTPIEPQKMNELLSFTREKQKSQNRDCLWYKLPFCWRIQECFQPVFQLEPLHFQHNIQTRIGRIIFVMFWKSFEIYEKTGEMFKYWKIVQYMLPCFLASCVILRDEVVSSKGKIKGCACFLNSAVTFMEFHYSKWSELELLRLLVDEKRLSACPQFAGFVELSAIIELFWLSSFNVLTTYVGTTNSFGAETGMHGIMNINSALFDWPNSMIENNLAKENYEECLPYFVTWYTHSLEFYRFLYEACINVWIFPSVDRQLESSLLQAIYATSITLQSLQAVFKASSGYNKKISGDKKVLSIYAAAHCEHHRTIYRAACVNRKFTQEEEKSLFFINKEILFYFYLYVCFRREKSPVTVDFMNLLPARPPEFKIAAKYYLDGNISALKRMLPSITESIDSYYEGLLKNTRATNLFNLETLNGYLQFTRSSQTLKPEQSSQILNLDTLKETQKPKSSGQTLKLKPDESSINMLRPETSKEALNRKSTVWLSEGKIRTNNQEKVVKVMSKFQMKDDQEIATLDLKQQVMVGKHPPQGPKASFKWLQGPVNVSHQPRNKKEQGNIQMLRKSNSNTLRIWELTEVSLPEILDTVYYRNDVTALLLKDKKDFDFMSVAAIYSNWDSTFGLKYLNNVQKKVNKLQEITDRANSKRKAPSTTTTINEWKERVDAMLITINSAKECHQILTEKDIASKASEFLLEPCVIIQLPWNCVLLHQWLAASLVEVLIFEHKSTELRHWPLPEKVVSQATELMTLVKQVKERIILGFAVMSKQVEMHPKLDRTHPAMIMDQVVLPSLATLQFLISGNATKILKSLKKISWSFSSPSASMMYVPASAYTMDDFLENVYSNLCYNFMIWEYVNVPAPFPGALFEQVDIDEVITRMNTKQTITPESNASMKPLSREEKFLCRIVDKNREAVTNSERVSIALKIIQECVLEPGRLPGLKLDQVRAYLDTEEIRSRAGFITREYDESSISDMILVSSLLFYEVYGMLIGSEKETSILACTVCQGLKVLEREQVIRLTKLLGEKFGILPVAVNINKDLLPAMSYQKIGELMNAITEKMKSQDRDWLWNQLPETWKVPLTLPDNNVMGDCHLKSDCSSLQDDIGGLILTIAKSSFDVYEKSGQMFPYWHIVQYILPCYNALLIIISYQLSHKLALIEKEMSNLDVLLTYAIKYLKNALNKWLNLEIIKPLIDQKRLDKCEVFDGGVVGLVSIKELLWNRCLSILNTHIRIFSIRGEDYIEIGFLSFHISLQGWSAIVLDHVFNNKYNDEAVPYFVSWLAHSLVYYKFLLDVCSHVWKPPSTTMKFHNSKLQDAYISSLTMQAVTTMGKAGISLFDLSNECVLISDEFIWLHQKIYQAVHENKTVLSVEEEKIILATRKAFLQLYSSFKELHQKVSQVKLKFVDLLPVDPPELKIAAAYYVEGNFTALEKMLPSICDSWKTTDTRSKPSTKTEPLQQTLIAKHVKPEPSNQPQQTNTSNEIMKPGPSRQNPESLHETQNSNPSNEVFESKPPEQKPAKQKVKRTCRNCSKKSSRKRRFIACPQCVEQKYPDVNYYCSEECKSTWWEKEHMAEHLEFELGLGDFADIKI